jgi:tRNA pseudouridine38-40 synthase
LEANHRLELQYDGTGLHGWAKQPGLPTVEGWLEQAFQTALGQVPVWEVAGRTDAGVHARRQVLSLRLPTGLDLKKLCRSLNALTPPEIAVMEIRPAPPGFNARAQASSRVYRYFLSLGPTPSPFWRRYCWHLPQGLDWEAMESAARAVAGRHDFTAFTPAETEHVHFSRRVFLCRWRQARGDFPRPLRFPGGSGAWPAAGGSDLHYLEIEAEAFLRHMVRALVGTMVEVGRGERDLQAFVRLLEGAPREAAGPTAPPQGLFLWDVKYGRKGPLTPADEPA